MPRLICVECKSEMKPERNGVYFVERATFGPYKIWLCDKWKCRKCGKEVLSGFGFVPLKEHYQEGFKEDLAELISNEKEEVIVESKTER